MKKLTSLLLAFLLMLGAFVVPSYAAEEEVPETVVEETVISWPSLWAYLDEETAGRLLEQWTAVLPEWLAQALLESLLACNASPGHMLSAAEASSVPFEVKNVRRYYNKKGELTYSLTLKAVFLVVNNTVTVLSSDTDYSILRGSWRITAGQPAVHGDTVSAGFTVSQLFTGVAVNTNTYTLTVKASDRARISAAKGDADMDGEITSADARIVLRAAVGLTEVTQLLLAVCDTDGNGEITSADARAILRLAVDLPSA